MEIRSPGYESYIIVKEYNGPFIHLVDIIDKLNPTILRRFSLPNTDDLGEYQNGRGIAYNKNYILSQTDPFSVNSQQVWLVYDIDGSDKVMPLAIVSGFEWVKALSWHDDYFLFKSRD